MNNNHVCQFVITAVKTDLADPTRPNSVIQLYNTNTSSTCHPSQKKTTLLANKGTTSENPYTVSGKAAQSVFIV